MKSILSYIFLILITFSTHSWSSEIWLQKELHHTALIVPTELVTNTTPELSSLTSESPYIRFGWGDAQYYGSSNKNLTKALKALFLPTGSVVEVAQFATIPKKNIKSILLDDSEALDLMHFILNSFALSPNNMPQLLRKEPSGSLYFKAHDQYHALHNCNNWTAKALYTAGVDIWYRPAYFSSWVMNWAD